MESSDLVFVSLENWDDIWRRNQFLCAGWARRRAGSRMLFVAPPIDLTHALRSGKVGELRRQSHWRIVEQGAITVIRPLKWWPNSWAAGRRLNERSCQATVRSAVRRMGIRHPLLWINDHSASHLCGHLGEAGVVYDVTDDWSSLSQSPKSRDLVLTQDRDLCRRADAVIVCSERLRQLKGALSRSVHLIPNGVDAPHYLPTAKLPESVAAQTRTWKRPVLGYTGSIHPDRVDLDLVENMARRMPRAMIALVGPVMLPPADLARLKRHENIILPGPQPYTQIPAWMNTFDVCIAPHRLSAFTESLNPIKLWEYLALGKPIIATPVAGFRDYPELVYLANTAEEFASALDLALSENRSLLEKRRSVAQANSWEKRLDNVEAILGRITGHE